MTPSIRVCVRARSGSRALTGSKHTMMIWGVCTTCVHGKKFNVLNKKKLQKKISASRIEIRFGVFRIRNNDDAAAVAFFSCGSVLLLLLFDRLSFIQSVDQIPHTFVDHFYFFFSLFIFSPCCWLFLMVKFVCVYVLDRKQIYLWLGMYLNRQNTKTITRSSSKPSRNMVAEQHTPIHTTL